MCGQHRRPLAECDPWDRHNHSVRFREDVWQDTERTAGAGDVVPFINEAVEARLGYIHCRRGSCMLDGPPVPLEFGDLTGKSFDEWLTEAVELAESQHPRHEPVRIGAEPGTVPSSPRSSGTAMFREPGQ
jgi:hypothetical protein